MRRRHISIAVATCSAARSASDVTESGALTMTSCAPWAAVALKRSGAWLPAGRAAPAGGRGGVGGQGRVQVGHHAHAPAGRVGPRVVGAVGGDLGRRAVLVAGGERV